MARRNAHKQPDFRGALIAELPTYKAVQKIGQETVDFESITENVSVRAKRVLVNLGVEDTDALLRITRDDLIQAWSCGKKTIAEIEALQTKLRSQNEQEAIHSRRDALDLDNAPKEITDVSGALLYLLKV
ncbi:MAG: hypothetical protein ABIL62_16045 [Planctomycetota bacterium]